MASFIMKSGSGFRMEVEVEFQVGRVSGSGFGVEVRFQNGDRSQGWVSVWWSRSRFGMGFRIGFQNRSQGQFQDRGGGGV